MCAGCAQSALEFGTANAAFLGLGARSALWRLRDRLGLSPESAAARAAKRPAADADFLEALGLDAAALLGLGQAPDQVPGDGALVAAAP